MNKKKKRIDNKTNEDELYQRAISFATLLPKKTKSSLSITFFLCCAHIIKLKNGIFFAEMSTDLSLIFQFSLRQFVEIFFNEFSENIFSQDNLKCEYKAYYFHVITSHRIFCMVSMVVHGYCTAFEVSSLSCHRQRSSTIRRQNK